LASDGGALIMMCKRDEEPPPSATTPNPLYISKYYRNYFFGKWNTCSWRGLPPFPSPHPMTNGYPYHQKQFLEFDECCDY